MRIVIVGNGIAGITCALIARKRDKNVEITVVSGEHEYFFSRTALMYVYMDKLSRRDLEPYSRKMYEEKNIKLMRDWVVDLDSDKKTIQTATQKTISYDKLVLAVGARPNIFPWEGIEHVQEGLVHFVSMQDLNECERLTPSTKEAVVVGGGLIGIELAESLAWHGVKVTFLIRESSFFPIALSKEESDFVVEHIREHGIDVRLNEEMTHVNVDAVGRVSSIKTNKDKIISCQMLGIAVGVRPNVDRLAHFSSPPNINKGIIVNDYLETSLSDVFAVGDCAEIHPRDEKPFSELIWYSAKRQGEVVGHNLFGDKKSYQRPIFFNSSKFFDIEYTTVGTMKLSDTTKTTYLKMPNQNISIRLVHNEDKILGFNMLGSRWDHEILQKWIKEERSPQFVMQNLQKAQYDVEFGRTLLKKMIQTKK